MNSIFHFCLHQWVGMFFSNFLNLFKVSFDLETRQSDALSVIPPPANLPLSRNYNSLQLIGSMTLTSCLHYDTKSYSKHRTRKIYKYSWARKQPSFNYRILEGKYDVFMVYLCSHYLIIFWRFKAFTSKCAYFLSQ